jgi:WD40 repeat protein
MPVALGDQQVPRPQEVFISYSRKDKEFVRRLDEELKRRDREAWVDWEGIPPGDTWEKTIYGAIEGTHTFIFVLTPDSIASEVCGKEIAHAAANNKRLVPIVHRDVADDEVPKSLGELNWIFFRTSDDFEEATDKLISALDTDLNWVRAHTRLLTRAIEWDANGRNNSFVLRGEDLRSAERWLAEAGAQKERQPTALQTEYIIASRKAAARRQRLTLGAVTFGAVVALALAVVAWTQRSKAIVQEKVAIKNAEEATRQKEAAIQTLSESDFRQGIKLIEEDRADKAMAHLARAVRLTSHSKAAARIAALLLQRGWALPVTNRSHDDEAVEWGWASVDGRQVVTVKRNISEGQRDMQLSDAYVRNGASGETIAGPLKHGWDVQAVAFSPDGSRIATARSDYLGDTASCARIWDAASGKPLTNWMEHEQKMTSVKFSPDGRWLLTTCGGNGSKSGGYAQVWDAKTGKALSGRMSCEQGETADFSPDGLRVVTGSQDKTVRIWDAATGKPLAAPMKYLFDLISAEFSPDGHRIITASCDFKTNAASVQIWDAMSGKPLMKPIGHDRAVNSVHFSSDGRRIVTACGSSNSAEGYAQLWDATTGQPLGERLNHKAAVVEAQFSRDGSLLLTVAQGGTVRIWEIATHNVITEPLRYTDFVDAAFTTDGHVRTSSRAAKQRLIWDVKRPHALPTILRHHDHHDAVTGAEFSPDASKILTQSSTTIVWDVKTGQQLPLIGERPDVAIDSARSLPMSMVSLRGGRTARFSPDGRTVVTVSSDRVFQVWDAFTGVPRKHFTTDTTSPARLDLSKVESAEFSLDGLKVLTSGLTVRIWNARTGELLSEPIKSDDGEMNVAHFSSDHAKVVTVFAGEARVWDAVTGKPLTEPMEHSAEVFNAEFSRDSRRLLTACSDPHADMPQLGYAQIWDATTGKAVTEPINYHDFLSCAHFSPDGSRLVTGYVDGVVRVWDSETGMPLIEPMNHEAEVRNAAFGDDGHRILTVVGDTEKQVGYAQIWDAETGVPLSDPMRHQGDVNSARFSPNGCQIVTACSDGTAQVWDIGPISPPPPWLADLAEAACGSKLSERGVLEPLLDAFARLEVLRRKMVTCPAGDEWAKLGRWFLADTTGRRRSPYAVVKPTAP